MENLPMQSTKISYPTPLYLNQRHVFDMLAMMENGFSLLRIERASENDAGEKSSSFGGGIGLKNIFAFLDVSLKGDRSAKQSEGSSHESSQEKVHTPNSLFARLRANLEEEKLIEREYEKAVPSSIVEFKLTLHKNPVLDSFESLKNLMPLAISAESLNSGGKGNKPAQKQGTSMKSISQFLDTFLSQMLLGNSVDLIASEVGDDKKQFVVTLEKQFLNDPFMADLLDGEFAVMGKVIQRIESESKDKINLLRHTTLGKASSQLVSTMMEGFSGMKSAGFEMPDPITAISGPVLHILPTAIFV